MLKAKKVRHYVLRHEFGNVVLLQEGGSQHWNDQDLQHFDLVLLLFGGIDKESHEPA